MMGRPDATQSVTLLLHQRRNLKTVRRRVYEFTSLAGPFLLSKYEPNLTLLGLSRRDLKPNMQETMAAVLYQPH